MSCRRNETQEKKEQKHKEKKNEEEDGGDEKEGPETRKRQADMNTLAGRTNKKKKTQRMCLVCSPSSFPLFPFL